MEVAGGRLSEIMMCAVRRSISNRMVCQVTCKVTHTSSRAIFHGDFFDNGKTEKTPSDASTERYLRAIGTNVRPRDVCGSVSPGRFCFVERSGGDMCRKTRRRYLQKDQAEISAEISSGDICRKIRPRYVCRKIRPRCLQKISGRDTCAEISGRVICRNIRPSHLQKCRNIRPQYLQKDQAEIFAVFFC